MSAGSVTCRDALIPRAHGCAGAAKSSGFTKSPRAILKQPKAGPKGEGQDARSQEHMGGPVSKRVFEFMDDQAIAIDTQALQGNRPS